MDISITSPHAPGVAQLIAAHNAFCNALSPAESCHNLTAAELDVPEITLWSARRGEQVIGIAALQELSGTAGEVKSMHVAQSARGTGAARVLLQAVDAQARARGYARLFLETGAMPDMAPARALYESIGFRVCPPFGDYREDPHSTFYALDLAQEPGFP